MIFDPFVNICGGDLRLELGGKRVDGITGSSHPTYAKMQKSSRKHRSRGGTSTTVHHENQPIAKDFVLAEDHSTAGAAL